MTCKEISFLDNLCYSEWIILCPCYLCCKIHLEGTPDACNAANAQVCLPKHRMNEQALCEDA